MSASSLSIMLAELPILANFLLILSTAALFSAREFWLDSKRCCSLDFSSRNSLACSTNEPSLSWKFCYGEREEKVWDCTFVSSDILNTKPFFEWLPLPYAALFQLVWKGSFEWTKPRNPAVGCSPEFYVQLLGSWQGRHEISPVVCGTGKGNEKGF